MAGFNEYCPPPDCLDEVQEPTGPTGSTGPITLPTGPNQCEVDENGNPVGFPASPLNILVTSPYIVGALDIRYEDPATHPHNGVKYRIIGVNIYKSMDSTLGPYEKINEFPVSALVFRDYTKDQVIRNEDVTTNFFTARSTDHKNRLIFSTAFKPIVQKRNRNHEALSNEDVEVKIYNPQTGQMQEVPIRRVNGENGEVELIKSVYFDPVLKKNVDPLLPDFDDPNNKVLITYRWGRSIVTHRLYDRIYYKVTTVALDENGNIIETPLECAEPVTHLQFGDLDYIWQEAQRRNLFILDQGGEWIKIFIRKKFGLRCDCYEKNRRKARSDCLTCYGTGYVGGYEGPFDVRMAPPEADQRIDLGELGLRMDYEFNTWIQDEPLVQTFDMIIRQDGSRYIIGSVTPTQIKGRILQQSLTLQLLEEGDIRYRVPVNPDRTIYGAIPEVWNGMELPPPVPDAPIVVDFDDLPVPQTGFGDDGTGSQIDPRYQGRTPEWAKLIENGETDACLE